MTRHRIFRVAPAMLAAVLAFPAIAAAPLLTPTAPGTPPTLNTTPSAREAPAAPAPMPARRAAQPASAGRARPTDRVEARIGDLHARLKISPAQTPQWDAFAGVMRDNARGMEAAFENRSTGRLKMNAVENMQSYATLADQHAQDLRRLAPAFAGLYNVMSDDQKRNADEVFRTERADGSPRRRR